MRERPGGAAKVHILADVIPPLGASGTPAAREADFQSHTVANFEAVFRDFLSHRLHHTCRLVAQRKRLSDENVTISIVAVVMQVRAAEASSSNGDLELVRARGFECTAFLDGGLGQPHAVSTELMRGRTVLRSLTP
jgi:hypothetical protein